jgi:hypothetical protein
LRFDDFTHVNTPEYDENHFTRHNTSLGLLIQINDGATSVGGSEKGRRHRIPDRAGRLAVDRVLRLDGLFNGEFNNDRTTASGSTLDAGRRRTT